MSRDADAPAGHRARRRVTWPWWVVAAVVVIAGAVASTQPWAAERPPGADDARTSVTPTAGRATPTPVTTPSPGTAATARPLPPVFDATTLALLFASQEEVVGAIPAAAAGLAPAITSGQLAWGLPAGSTIEPATCTVASTVVAEPPAAFDARSWSATLVELSQQVTVLPDVPSAEAAFRTLVTTVDACGVYSQVDAGVATSTTTASPATEAQGVYPSLVQRTELAAGGVVEPQLHGHILVGNAIVTWTASARPQNGAQADVGVLGSGGTIDAALQAVAARAASTLGPPVTATP
ncbi:hypothetical protein DDP54_12655 [Cellulomonas sp. WB94]|uniref:hypothetical protein n=1 Tax=Cellulomonas sp. WB94 TaxID=2173174 RepID=UPI000D56A63F|nr:hypothetical protein [Cellulomonas sp. WB94]PVU83705.1 hypothetical protein DDP54_12655 [Cellulomonas sp. WB94]